MADLAASLLRLEGEKIEVVPNTKEGKQAVLSDADLDVLLDRRPEVFAERGLGWTSGGGGGGAAATGVGVVQAGTVGGSADERGGMGRGRKAAFAVYEAPVEEGNDALAKMLGEDEAE